MKFDRDSKTISELYEMYKKGVLILQPFFQRNLVWTEKAKSRFIESILLELPIAEIYLYQDNKGKLSVIDGQQRLSTVFNFIDKKFHLKELEKITEIEDQDIDFSYKRNFLEFKIHFVVIDSSTSKGDIIDMYSRINEYTVNLNDQELRKAAYNDSDFLKLSEELALLEFFEYGRFFTPRKRQRMNDVEYVSELLAVLIDGIQDKKNTLDDFYKNNTHIANSSNLSTTFSKIIQLLERVFSFKHYFIDEKKKYNGNNPAKNFGFTRYRQQADFYSLFLLFKELEEQQYVFSNIKAERFLRILLLLDYLIEPESDIDILSTYAVKCVSQGNTKKSREFRYELLKKVFEYIDTENENELIRVLKDDFKEIFEINIDFLNFDLKDIKEKIDLFYADIED